MTSVGDLRETKEGLATLLVHGVSRASGPGKKTGEPFYNPAMQRNRDMSVLFLRGLNRPGLRVLDGLSATGATGIRIALEVPGVMVTCNDRDGAAVDLIKRNAELNNVRLEAVHNEAMQALLCREKFDYIDIDPFGTPAPYLDSTFRAVKRDGVVAVTATDTAVLCGSQPRTCIRRYDARPLHIDCCKEVALRLLLGSCARTAARYDRAIVPLVTFGIDHFFRAFMAVEQGSRKADECLSRLGYVCYDRGDGRRWISRAIPPEGDWAGPLWMGDILADNIVASLTPLHYMGHGTSRLVEDLKSEVGAPPLYTTTGAMAKTLQLSPPRILDILEALRAAGFRAVRTHLDPGGIKTDAPQTEFAATYSSLAEHVAVRVRAHADRRR